MTQTTTKKIKLMPNYGCHPLWWAAGSGKAGNIDPRTLPLKPETIARLEKWADVFDNLFNEDDPASSGFSQRQGAVCFRQRKHRVVVGIEKRAILRVRNYIFQSATPPTFRRA